MNESSSLFSIIDSTLAREDNKLSVAELCSIAGVSRSGYYAWKKAEPLRTAREAQDRKDFELILSVYKRRGYAKGARSIAMGLIHLNPPVVMNLKKIHRLMNKYHLMCPVRKANPYRRMSKAMKTNQVADNLLQREFECYGPRMVLLTDITYLPYEGTFAYLSTILDAYKKQILAYVLSASLEVDFVLDTVNLLMAKHKISLNAETLIHSDQGCHYTSHKFIDLVESCDLRRSMSRRGNCWDNAPQESFFGHMKDEIDLSHCKAFDDVKTVIDDFMDYYNNERYQWDLAKLSPNEYYEFVTTGVYPLDVPNKPTPPTIQKSPSELGKKEEKSKDTSCGLHG